MGTLTTTHPTTNPAPTIIMKTAFIVLCLAAMALADIQPLPVLLRSNVVNVDDGGANMIGSYKMLNAEGELVDVKFVANEFGFQPESSLLPVAPAFPHPIPQFVLDQIAFAEQQRQAQSQEQ